MEINKNNGELDKIIKRYQSNPFMYVEYPHKRFWNKKFENLDETKEYFKESIIKNKDKKFLFYVHIPHCHTQCLYCTCHVEITKDYSRVKRFLDYLYKELDMLNSIFEEIKFKPNFTDFHLGGGSPTYPKIEDFDILIDKLSKFADLRNLNEFSIEIDPRRVKEDKIEYYHSKGINRISLGVQEFDPEVQKMINRVQPDKLIERILTPKIRKLFKHGINFDIICGLPGQNLKNFEQTVKKIINFHPDRICLNYMHLSTKFHPHQLRMPKDKIPDENLRKELFSLASNLLEDNHYARAGYDHFVSKDDKLYDELKDNKLKWNRLGIVTGNYENIIGAGVSSVGKIEGDFYYQNTFENDEYEKLLSQNKLPISNYHVMSGEDKLREEIIQSLRTYFYLDIKQIEKKFNLDFHNHFKNEVEKIKIYEKEKMLAISSDEIEIINNGTQFANLIASEFDTYISGS